MPATASEIDWLISATGGSVREFYASLGVALPDRGGEEASIRCFANPTAHTHDDRNASCSVNLLTGLWHCKGCGASGNPYQAALALGRPEADARKMAQSHGLFLDLAKPVRQPRVPLPNERQLKKWRQAMRENASVLARLQEVRGWTPYAVVRLGLGWDGQRITFPIRNQKLKIAGLVRYLPGGDPKSLAAPGSKRDLFPPPELIHRRHPLFVVEGEGDAVAVWSTGHKAVGVPGAGSWRSEWAQRLYGRTVVILADADTQGRSLAAKIAENVPKARVVDVEPGRSDGFDFGDVLRECQDEGGTWQARAILDGLVAA